jgi:hypothetical protein
VLAAFIVRAIALTVEEGRFSEIWAIFYQTARDNSPEDSHLQCVIISSDFLILKYILGCNKKPDFRFLQGMIVRANYLPN